MSPAVAACAACGHVFSERDALDPCPECGGTERTLRRETLIVDQPDPDTTVEVRQVAELEPDGSCTVVEEPVQDFSADKPAT